MPPFLGQAVIRAPQNETPKQLKLLGDTLGRALEQRRDMRTKQEIGQAFQQGGLPAAQQAAFRSGRPDLGINFTNMLEQQRARAEQQALQQQRLGIAQSQLGLAQNADARAAEAAKRTAAMHAAKLGFIGGLTGGGGQAMQAPQENPYYSVPATQGAGNFGMTQPAQAAPQAMGAPSLQNEIAAGVLGLPGVAKSIRSARTSSPEYLKEQVTAKKRAEYEAKLPEKKIQATSSLDALHAQHNIVEESIDRALALAESGEATGMNAYGSLLPWETSARELANELKTIKANLGFDKLQEMRANSPTGGALGQVSERELAFLQSAQGTLDPVQKKQLVNNLKKIKDRIKATRANLENAYKRQFGEEYERNAGWTDLGNGIRIREK